MCQLAIRQTRFGQALALIDILGCKIFGHQERDGKRTLYRRQTLKYRIVAQTSKYIMSAAWQ
jgi:hypothetical protein